MEFHSGDISISFVLKKNWHSFNVIHLLHKIEDRDSYFCNCYMHNHHKIFSILYFILFLHCTVCTLHIPCFCVRICTLHSVWEKLVLCIVNFYLLHFIVNVARLLAHTSSLSIVINLFIWVSAYNGITLELCFRIFMTSHSFYFLCVIVMHQYEQRKSASMLVTLQ